MIVMAKLCMLFFINCFRRLETTQMQWEIFVSLALLKLMQEDHEFKESLSCIVRSCLKTNQEMEGGQITHLKGQHFFLNFLLSVPVLIEVPDANNRFDFLHIMKCYGSYLKSTFNVSRKSSPSPTNSPKLTSSYYRIIIVYLWKYCFPLCMT